MCGSCRRWTLPPLSGRTECTWAYCWVGHRPHLLRGCCGTIAAGASAGSAPVNWHRLLHSTPLITSYIYEKPKKGESSGSYVFIQRGDGATDGDDVSGPLSSVDCTRPTTSITRPACSTLPIRSKSNPQPMMTSSSGRHSSQQSRTSQ
jgi:hypothetical protein